MEDDPAKVTELLTFLRSHNSAVLATVRNGSTPHATTIYFYVEDDLNFYFLTKNETAKFDNIKKNINVALVVSDTQTLQTVQLEGTAQEVDYTKTYASTMNKLLSIIAKNGEEWEKIPLNHVENSGYFVFVQIKPTWLRFSDYKNWQHTTKFEKRFS
ncbi:MAG TPA: pyridoxamine 5'-phosphate oxidase family protein [Patescibacteria group bacterium]